MRYFAIVQSKSVGHLVKTTFRFRFPFAFMIEEKWRGGIIVFGCKMKDVLKSFGNKQETEKESERKEGERMRVREGESSRERERERVREKEKE